MNGVVFTVLGALVVFAVPSATAQLRANPDSYSIEQGGVLYADEKAGRPPAMDDPDSDSTWNAPDFDDGAGTRAVD